MRVLFCYRDDVDLQGGAALMMNDLTEAIRRQGLEVDVSYEAEPDVSGYDIVTPVNIWSPYSSLQQMRHLHASGVPLVWLPIYTHWSEVAWAIQAVPTIFRELPRAERDPYLSAMEDGSLTLPNGFNSYLPNQIVPEFHAILQEMVSYVDHMLVYSNHEMQFFQQTVKPQRQPRFSVLRHAARVDVFSEGSAADFRAHTGINDEFVMTVGTPNPLKNQVMVIEALRDTGIKYCIVGRCHEPAYNDLLQREGGDDVIFVDFIPRELVSGAYRAANVHISASFAECAPQVNIEAAISGCPIVVSNRSSEYEYYGDYAVYIDPASRSSIKEGIMQAWDGRQNEPYRWQMLSEKARGWNWDDAAASVVEAYEKTLATRRLQYDRAARSQAGLAGARAFVAVGSAAEMISQPELLKTWADEFNSSDPVTLVLLSEGRDEEELADALEPLLEEAGLDSEDSADILLADGDADSIAAAADCLWGSAVQGPEERRLAGDDAVSARMLLKQRQQATWASSSD